MKETFEDKRKLVLMSKRKKLKTYKDDGLCELFKDKSYAIIKGDFFVPLIPRHMTKENWRELFWRETKKVVLHGKTYKSLCMVCRLGLSCLSRGNGKKFDFECRASPEIIIVPLTKRKKGEV